MSNCIFYFTASGNSLAIARTVAQRLGDTEVLPMAKHLHGFAGTDEDRIGFVFPIYLWGLPRMVSEFASKLQTRSGQHIFAIANGDGAAGQTLVQLRKILRANGSELHAGFVARADVSIFHPGRDDDPRAQFVSRLFMRNLPPTANQYMDEIVDAVRRRAPHGPETTTPFVSALFGPLMRQMAQKELKIGDKHFSVTEGCTSCGTCVRVCPRENVTLKDGRPLWHHDCETCYACLLWCPERAIACRDSSPKDPTHHPEIVLTDILLR